MNTAILPQLGAACGAVFAIVLFVAAGNGSGDYSAPRAIAGLSALTLFVPFLAYLCSLLRAAEGPNGWLAPTALTAGLAGITLKIVSVIPALALHRAHIADGTALHKLFDAFDNGTTVIALYPFAAFCAATAILTFRTGALPRWLGAAAAFTAAALAINGAFLEASFLPALLLFIAWTLAASLLSFAGLRSSGLRSASLRPPQSPDRSGTRVVDVCAATRLTTAGVARDPGAD